MQFRKVQSNFLCICLHILKHLARFWVGISRCVDNCVVQIQAVGPKIVRNFKKSVLEMSVLFNDTASFPATPRAAVGDEVLARHGQEGLEVKGLMDRYTGHLVGREDSCQLSDASLWGENRQTQLDNNHSKPVKIK